MGRIAGEVTAAAQAVGLTITAADWTEPRPVIDCYLLTVATATGEVSAVFSRYWVEGYPDGEGHAAVKGIIRALVSRLAAPGAGPPGQDRHEASKPVAASAEGS